jgi:hypothetical protein
MLLAMKLAAAASILLALVTGCHPFDPINPELVNGDFEQSPDTGWLPEVSSGDGYAWYEWSDTLGQPDSGYAVRITRSSQGYGRLRQIVTVDGDRHEFGFTGRFRLGGNRSCVPVGAVILSYIDRNERRLGSTRWYLPGPGCDWASSDTCHLIEAPADQWSRHYLILHDELANNLRGIGAGDVKRVQIEITARVESSG